MMDELKQIKQVVNPTEVLLVVDAMTGQEAAGIKCNCHVSSGMLSVLIHDVCLSFVRVILFKADTLDRLVILFQCI